MLQVAETSLNDFLRENVDINKINNCRDFAAYSLGIYDHWLTESEARELILSFPVIEDSKSEDKDLMAKYLKKEKEFIDFFLLCFQNHRMVYYDFSNHFYFESEEEFVNTVRKMLREEDRPLLYLSDLNVVIYGGFDLTCGVYCKKKESFDSLQKYLEETPSLFFLKE